jgi:hypothetical protein
MEILIKTIPHKDQRYETAGDYWFDGDKIDVRVSDMANDDYAFLVAVHELVELYLTKKKGISEPDIMAFDIAHPDSSEPGAEPDAPYYKEHLFASAIEMLMAGQLGINWQDYDKKIMEL